jgi:hypothetical protein
VATIITPNATAQSAQALEKSRTPVTAERRRDNKRGCIAKSAVTEMAGRKLISMWPVVIK